MRMIALAILLQWQLSAFALEQCPSTVFQTRSMNSAELELVQQDPHNLLPLIAQPELRNGPIPPALLQPAIIDQLKALQPKQVLGQAQLQRYLGSVEQGRQNSAQAIDHFEKAIQLGHQTDQQLVFESYHALLQLYSDPFALSNARDWLIYYHENYDVGMEPAEKYRALRQLYRQSIDDLLREAQPLPQATLRQVVDRLEKLKVVELKEYYLDDCVIKARERAAPIPADVTLYYPIVLADRVETITLRDGNYQHYTTDISESRLRHMIDRFRRLVQESVFEDIQERGLRKPRTLPNFSHQNLSEQLYRILLADIPLHDTILIILPDGPLRLLPYAALSDGRRYLLEKNPIVFAQAMSLTDTLPQRLDHASILFSGVSESVQEFTALKGVLTEADNLRDQYGGDVTLLLNEQFTVDEFRQQITDRRYDILHFASHGQFEPENQQSFLLAYSEKLTMKQLEEILQRRKYSDNPIDMLTLSACQTAIGDEYSALGLAGVGIMAGAKTALGSLWNVSDEATIQLMRHYYANLRSLQGRAEALRNAQLSLLDSGYSHPFFWAPYLLIGNWQ
jgi:CHAT domain-containing protein